MIGFARVACLACLVSLIFFVDSVNAQTATTKEDINLAVHGDFESAEIPIFFATNRDRGKNGEVSLKGYGSKVRQTPGLDYGVCFVKVPLSESLHRRIAKMTDGDLKELHWKLLKDKLRKKEITSTKVISTDSFTPQGLKERPAIDQFIEQIGQLSPLRNLNNLFSSRVDAGGHMKPTTVTELRSDAKEIQSRKRNNRVVVFVHGFNCAISTAVSRAADLSLASGQPVIAFSWPAKTSKNPLVAYDRDFTHCESSRLTFNAFLRSIDDAYGAHALTLVGHSMGSHLLCWAISERVQFYAGEMALSLSLGPLFSEECKSGRLELEEALHIQKFLSQRLAQSEDNIYTCYPQQLGAVVFLSPDLDQRAFLSDITECKNHARRLLVFVSAADQALKLSRIHSGEMRAGSNVHGGWSVRYVDFSEVGEAPFGHTAPVEQVFDILSTNSPCPGYFLDFLHQNAVRIQKCEPGISTEWYPSAMDKESPNPGILFHLSTKWANGKIAARSWLSTLAIDSQKIPTIFKYGRNLCGIELLTRDGRTIKLDVNNSSDSYQQKFSQFSWRTERELDCDTYYQIVAWRPSFNSAP